MGTPTPPQGTGPGASSSWGRLPHASGAGIATRRAIGTDIRLVVADATALGVAEAVVDTVIDRVDELASRFRADSELSRLNALAIGGGTFLLSPELREHLAAALAGARWSGGLLDPTIGDALVGAGYDRDLDEVPPDDARPARAGLVPGWRAVELRGALLEVGPGTQLDLGATAKALAVDQATRAVAARCGGGCLVSFGGDLAVAPAGAATWTVQVEEAAASLPPAPSQVVAVTAGGVATSSTTRRRWRRDGAVQHHLIDPATGAPATGPYRTVTVAAPTCLEANIASTAALVAGAGAIRLLERSGLPARLVDVTGRVRMLGGWPDGDGAALPTVAEPLLGPGRRAGAGGWWS